MNTQKEIYRRLVRVIPNIYYIKESGKSESQGFMDFNLDILQRNGDVLIAQLVSSIGMPSIRLASLNPPMLAIQDGFRKRPSLSNGESCTVA